MTYTIVISVVTSERLQVERSFMLCHAWLAMQSMILRVKLLRTIKETSSKRTQIIVSVDLVQRDKKEIDDSQDKSELPENYQYSRMSRQQLEQKCRQLSQSLRYSKKALRTARALLKKEKDSAFIASDDDEFKSIMIKAAEYVEKEESSSVESIMRAIMDVTTSEDLKRKAKLDAKKVDKQTPRKIKS